mmetsp:Transcript_3983/g.15043  ORF Transcript_3983/g.15043 Transcript_3983/m.15043 type:complete len:237 (+) Transcript_3983:1-711(+)
MKHSQSLLSQLTPSYLASLHSNLSITITSLPENDIPSQSLMNLINFAYSVENDFKCQDRFTSFQELVNYSKDGQFLLVHAIGEDLLKEMGENGNEEDSEQVFDENDLEIEKKNASDEVSKDDCTLIACVCLQQDPTLKDAIYFGCLALHPKFQSRGIGSVIINVVENVARQFNAKWLTLDAVDIRQDLIKYYEKRGFETYGTRPWPEQYQWVLREEYRGGKVHFVMMKKEIVRRDD